MKSVPYLRSKSRRGRWFHTYRRGNVDRSLGVHGLHPSDPRVLAAWAAEHARWQDCPPDTETPASGTFAWAVDLYTASPQWAQLAKNTRKARLAIYRRYRKVQGARPVSSISSADLEAALYIKGGHGAINELKALKPVFSHLHKLRFISKNPAASVDIVKPKIKGYPTANADEIRAFMKRWPIGTLNRLIFDLALYTGAARVDLCRIGCKNIKDGLLTFNRQKTGTLAEVPLSPELRAVIARTPDISPTFILSIRGAPFAPESLGNRFAEAATAAGMVARLHGLRKAFCVYWAEQGATTHQIAAMAGHMSLSEVERYTRAVDRTRLVKLLVRAT